MSAIKTAWNLGLLYSSLNDPQIERDVRAMERATVSFEKKYRGKNAYLKTPTALAKALTDYEKLVEAPDGKPIMYAHYTKELDSANIEAEGLLRRLEERYTKAGNRTLFFALAIAKIPKEKHRGFLKHPSLKRYRYFLDRTWKTAKYDRTEAEEKVLSLMATPSYTLWVDGLEKALSKRSVEWQGNTVPLAGAQNLVRSLPTQEERVDLWKRITDAFDTVSDFAESELNAVIVNRKIRQELRGYKYSAESTILAHENEPKTVKNLIAAVSGAFDLSQEFYALKKELLHLPRLTYADRAVPLAVEEKDLPFSEAAHAVGAAFRKLHPRYEEVLQKFLMNGQIDVYPKKGKAGGAYCSHSHGLPTFVLLNHVNDFESMMTLAHEMGHAIHSERSKLQPALYEGYSTSVAETASTFFESLAFEETTKTLPDSARMAVLHNRLQDDIQSIFRQVAFYKFEEELHERIKKEGSVAKEEIAALLNRHMKAYMGEVVELTPADGLFFVAVSHFRRPFYVYSYAFGLLIAKALLARFKENPAFIEKIDAFLSAGGSDTPERIFKKIGIDIQHPSFFKKGLSLLRKDLEELKVLAHKGH